MLNSQAAMANAYKNQQIMTASPEQLTLLLYNGALRFLNESIQAMEEGELQKSHNANMRVQAIISEFVVTLDMNYEISQNWAALYEYIEHCLIEGNVKKDVQQLNNAKAILEDMRNTWQEAMKLAQQAKVAGV
ncbi:flagellar export chaperone FliS [Desulfitobacterium chlororespirans]|uniref:Flagellar secretion chaperone FliS n=1 Tax=Desulfitobacterium chlororespirans DSM 11544 TaxID=1121395 RepID=A0A1M7UDC7_9FIRM|nr:flagellar export chaperone FliS [Desulfitobacterium chlororespirans]SHN80956.1 flagellar protein FliS [Desulfitobacterium chlororespirans DSM 11544]